MLPITLQYDRYDKSADTADTVPELLDTLKDTLKGSLSLRFECIHAQIEELEYKSRDGFSAHSHNRGGIDYIAYTDVARLLGSGEHFGTSIQAAVTESYSDALSSIKDQFPEATDEEIDGWVYEYCSDEYSGIAFRVRLMYEGLGVLRVYWGWDLDAPYYRWDTKELGSATIKFRTMSGLRRQLTKVLNNITY